MLRTMRVVRQPGSPGWFCCCRAGPGGRRGRTGHRVATTRGDRPAGRHLGRGHRRGATFYAGDLFAGDIFRGKSAAAPPSCSSTPLAGRQAVGMAADLRHNLLFVAGGFTGQGYVYDLVTGATVASYQFVTPPATVINDVAVTKGGAWFTDSMQAQLYFVPVSRADPGAVPHAGAQRPGGRHQRGVQPQRHPGHRQRQDPDRGPLGQRPARHGRPGDRGQRHHRRVSVPNVDGIVLQGRRRGRCRTATR